MCRTHKIASELDLKLLKHLKGSEQHDLPDGPLEDGAYLVEQDGEKLVLKTGNFNPQEVDDNWALSEAGIRTQRITESVPEEYILYEYLDGPLMSQQDFWSDNNMQKVFDLHQKISEGLAARPLGPEQVIETVEWMDKSPFGKWLEGSGYTEEQQTRIKSVANDNATWKELPGIAWAYRDNNGDHYVDLGDELGVLDVDILPKPKHYMDMRYLAWTILWMPAQQLTLEWVKAWVEKLGVSRERYVTFLVSLVGILWDIESNGTYAKTQAGKVETIKEIVEWVIDQLGGKNE